MNIVQYTKEDESKLEEFKSIVWPVADQEHYGNQQPDFYKKDFTLIVKEGSDIIGYVSVIIDTGVAQIEPLMVKTDMQGKGVGSALLAKAEEKAKSAGAHKVWLETGSEWKAKGFYKKHGYQVRTILPNHNGGREFVLMDKML